MRTTLELLTNNFLDLDTLPNTAVSSSQAAFPVTNAYNKFRRSKVYRSNGYWEVVSGENEIIFEETSPAPLTATIAVGTYTSTAAFLAAVKAALDAAGASTYTVESDASTNYKLKITSNGAGGTGIFNLLLSNVGFTAADLLGFETIDLTGALNYTADSLKIHTGEWVEWDMGMAVNPQAFCLTGPRNRPLRFSPNATIKLQGNPTNDWTNPAYEEVVPYDEEVLVLRNVEGLHTQALRYWRILFIDQSPNGFVEVGAFFLGEVYSFSQGGINSPISEELDDKTETQESEGGQEITDEKEQFNSYAVAMDGLTQTETDLIDEIWQEFGLKSPFFVILDADLVFSTSLNRRTKYVKFGNRPSRQIRSKQFFTITFTFREQL